METRKQNIFKQFFLSLYNFNEYRRFANVSGGRVVVYTLLMVLITYLITFILPFNSALVYIYRIDEATVDEYVPYFEVKNGVFHIEKEVYVEDGGVSVFFATSEQAIPTETAREILKAYAQGFIISAKEMVIKQMTGSVQIYSFSMAPDMSRGTLYEFLPVIKSAVIIAYILVFVFYIGAYFFGALVCAILGYAISFFVKAPVLFGNVFKMTAYARTAPILLKMALLMFLPANYITICFYAAFVFYIIKGLKACQRVE